MLCQKCQKNEATYHYHENIGGAEKTLHLCRTCRQEAEQAGDIGNTDLTLHSMFESFFGDPMIGLFDGMLLPMQTRTPVKEKKCTCGMTLRELTHTRMAGCPLCWTTFGKELASSIAAIHGKAAHTGRSHAKKREADELRRRIEALTKERDAAVAQENYERAAQIRDEIRGVKNEG